MDNIHYKVSVIVPVYKAEKYISRCVKSLLEQSLDSIEYIFVDDCTPDNSIDILSSILDSYPKRRQDVKIIKHPINMGVAASRQDGLDAATGLFVIHCDPDDWVEKSAYEKMYAAAVANDAELVICDYYIESSGHSRLKKQIMPSPMANQTMITSLCKGKIFGASWNKLIKREVICKNNIHFIEELNVCEDLFFLISLLMKEEISICHLKEGLYHYDVQINPNSIQRAKLQDHLSQDNRIISLCIEMLSDRSYQVASECLQTNALFNIFQSKCHTNKTFVSDYRHLKTLRFSNRGYVSFFNRFLIQLSLIGFYEKAYWVYLTKAKLRNIIKSIAIKKPKIR